MKIKKGYELMRFSLMTFMCELPLLLEGEWTEEKSSRILQLISDAGKAGYTGVDLVAETLKRIGRERIERALKEQHLELTSVICVGRLADQ